MTGRLLKHLASMQVIKEVGVDCYQPTEVARALTVPQYRDAIPFWCVCFQACIVSG
jgi:hypothetical protein